MANPNTPNPVDPLKCGGCKHWTVDYFPHGNYEFEFWNCEHKNHYGKRLVKCNRINRVRPVACIRESIVPDSENDNLCSEEKSSCFEIRYWFGGRRECLLFKAYLAMHLGKPRRCEKCLTVRPVACRKERN